MTGGGMTYIDIDASVSESWAATQRLASDLTLITSGGATLASGTPAQRRLRSGEVSSSRLSGGFATEGVKLPGLIDGTIWVPAPELGTSRSGVAYRLVTSDGLAVDGATIDLPEAELIGSDGHGGLVVARGGDVFVVSVDGAERLSSGELIAIVADTAYVRECTEVTACDVTRIDRRIGVRSSSDGGIDADDLTTASTVEEQRSEPRSRLTVMSCWCNSRTSRPKAPPTRRGSSPTPRPSDSPPSTTCNRTNL